MAKPLLKGSPLTIRLPLPLHEVLEGVAQARGVSAQAALADWAERALRARLTDAKSSAPADLDPEPRPRSRRCDHSEVVTRTIKGRTARVCRACHTPMPG